MTHAAAPFADPAPRPLARVHLAFLFVQLVFGGFHVVGKLVMGSVEPLALAGIRVIFAVPILGLAAWTIERYRPTRADLWAFAKLGLFGVFLNQVLFIVGLSYTTATNVGILMPAIPVFTAALAAAFRVERLTAAKIVGIASAVAGALVVLDAARAAPMSGRLLGNVLILANCASYAMYLVLQRPVLARVPPLTLTAGAYAAGGLGVVIVSSSSLSEFTHQTHASLVYLGLAYVILMPTILGYAANMWAVRHSSSTLAATYVTLQPIVTASLAAIFLGETLGWREAIALVLIVTGLMLVAGVMPRWKRHAALEPEPPEAEPDEEPSPIATGGAPFE